MRKVRISEEERVRRVTDADDFRTCKICEKLRNINHYSKASDGSAMEICKYCLIKLLTDKPRTSSNDAYKRKHDKTNLSMYKKNHTAVSDRIITEHKRVIEQKLKGISMDDVIAIIYRAGRFQCSVEEITDLWVRCGGKCEICGDEIFLSKSQKKESGGVIACCDHDHGSGRVRGMLCNRCNLTVIPGYELAIYFGESKVRNYLGINVSNSESRIPASIVRRNEKKNGSKKVDDSCRHSSKEIAYAIHKYIFPDAAE